MLVILMQSDLEIFNKINSNDISGFKQEYDRLSRENKLDFVKGFKGSTINDYVINSKNVDMINYISEQIKKRGSIRLSEIKPEHIDDAIDKYLNNKIDKNILNCNIGFSHFEYKDDKFRFSEDRDNPLTLLGHLNSWKNISTKNSLIKPISKDIPSSIIKNNQIQVEGYHSIYYARWKIISLIDSLKKIADSKDDKGFVEMFGENKSSLILKLKKEIKLQIYAVDILKTQVTLSRIKSFNPKLSNDLNAIHVENVSKKLNSLQKGEELFFHVHQHGHYTQVSFKRENDTTFTRQIFNLGAGLDHHDVKNGKFLPNKTERIPSNIFSTKEGKSYIANIMSTDLHKTIDEVSNPIKKVIKSYKNLLQKVSFYNNYYNKIGGSKGTFDPQKDLAQKMQSVGNCTIKNCNSGIQNRLNNKNLFNWLKRNEREQLLNHTKDYIPSFDEKVALDLKAKNSDKILMKDKLKSFVKKSLNGRIEISNETIIRKLEDSYKSNLMPKIKFRINANDLSSVYLKDNTKLLMFLVKNNFYDINSKNDKGESLLSMVSSIPTNRVGLSKRRELNESISDLVNALVDKGAKVYNTKISAKKTIEISNNNINENLSQVRSKKTEGRDVVSNSKNLSHEKSKINETIKKISIQSEKNK